mmetsp:Transcript_4792/g.11378  ORF Transcript_4792/g.11378 Transcript_4792/m.11378 type:complete len:265 (+) Transcript_4792:962-1756(+)
MDQDHDANGTRCETPRILPGMLLFLVRVLERDVEHLCEILSEAVGRGTLDPSSGGRNERLDGGSVQTASELFFLSLLPLDHRDGEQILVDILVQLEDGQDLLLGLAPVGERRVSLLPEELARADERGRIGELPAHDVAPLVELQGEVAMGSDPGGIVRVHHGLGGRADGNRFLQVGLSRLCDPGDLRGKTLDVILFTGKVSLGDEEGEVAVLHAKQLNARIEVFRNALPDVEGPGTENVAARHIVLLQHARSVDALRVPLERVL